MIGKVTIGKSFRGCVLYCLNDKRPKDENEHVMKDRTEILMFNQCYGDQKEIVQQFEEVRRLNMKLSKPVLHISLSLAPGEKLSKDKLMEMCQDCAKEMKFENNQYIAVHHRDTGHQHIHIVANRVGYNGRTVSDSNSYQKIASYCRKMELKYGLQKVLNPKRFLSRSEREMPRVDARMEQIKNEIGQALKESGNYAQFENKMKQKGYQVIKGRGISFIDDKKVKVKGSDIGFSLQTIDKILKAKQSLDIKKLLQKNQIQKPELGNKQVQRFRLDIKKKEAKNESEKEADFSKSLGISTEPIEVLQSLLEAKQMNEELPYELSQKAHLNKQKRRHR